MVWISNKQKEAMILVRGLVDEFGINRWFVKEELPGITKHSMDALVNKGYLDAKFHGMLTYYRRLKELEDDSK